jgi:uncharacterized protein (DUF488 family)
MNVWTIGHSTHTLDAFVALLAEHDIALLADIRTVPKSRRATRVSASEARGGEPFRRRWMR